MSANSTRTIDIASTGIRGSARKGTRNVLPEEHFLTALYLEQRRSERSGNSLLLALVHADGAVWTDVAGQFPAAAAHLGSRVRETDTIGWYEKNKILGLIFTELRESPGGDAQNSIDVKLKQVLCSQIPAVTPQDIRVTYHVFPGQYGSSGSGDPILYPEAQTSDRTARFLKRCLDVGGSLAALIAASPLLLLIFIAVKLTSKGSFLYRQQRVGERGRVFTLLKIRSMFQNSDSSVHRDYVTRLIEGKVSGGSSGAAIYKMVDDPRITPVGRILRRASLDELPQFFNVLKGDMSLVGPRPPLPYEFERYSAWHCRRVMEVRPGLTGLWQVHGRSRTTFDEAVRLDLRYVRHWSLWLDLKILLKTPAAVISGDGAC